VVFKGTQKAIQRTGFRIQQEDFVYVSIASVWEIAIKVSLRKLEIPGTFDELFPRYIYSADFELLPIETRHLSCVANLPLHHKDPFDRLIISQATCDDLVIATCDPVFSRYSVETVW
jgi:PIN domain nuclease of toxin-antitoxin system